MAPTRDRNDRYQRRHGVTAGETARRSEAHGAGPSFYLTHPEGHTVELEGRHL